MMKKIGFIDFFLDEWHANNFPAWIRDNCRAVGRDIEIAYAWAQVTAPSGLDTAAWCAKYGVQALSSIAEVVEKSDFLVVFSPDHPEHHESLANLALMSGKPVYIDKTFSPDLRSGARMFDLAEKFHTPMFSTSALRNAKELAVYLDDPASRSQLEYVAATGPGKYANYAVHQFEMIVALLGPGASRVKSLSSEHGGFLSVEYPSGRRASMLQISAAPFQVLLQFKAGESKFIPECSDIFPRQIHSLLDFFETGVPPVPRGETLEIMALIEAGRKAIASYDTWVPVEKA
jgi:hypothetical protein